MVRKSNKVNLLFIILAFCMIHLSLNEATTQLNPTAPASAVEESGCFLDSVKNAMSLLEQRISEYLAVCSHEGNPELLEMAGIAQDLGEIEGLLKNGGVVEDTRWEKLKSLPPHYQFVSDALALKDNGNKHEEIIVVFQKFKADYDALAAEKKYPYFLKNNGWQLIKYKNFLGFLKFGFIEQECLPYAVRHITTLEEATNDPISQLPSIDDKCRKKEDSEIVIDPIGFGQGGYAFAFWVKEEYTTIPKEGVSVFKGYKDNIKVFDLVVKTNQNLANPKLINVLTILGKDIAPIETSITCTDYAFILVAVEQDCDHYKVTVVIRLAISNKRYSKVIIAGPDLVENTRIEIQKDRVINPVEFDKFFYSLQEEKRIVASSSSSFSSNLSQLNKICISDPKCDVYSEKEKCLVCKDPYKKYNGECYNPCPPATFQVPNTKECKDCCTNCITCDNENTCTECDKKTQTSLLLRSGKTICITPCPLNTWKADGKCSPCTDHCDVCLSATTCDKCDSTTFNDNGKCVPSCPAGYYANLVTRKCEICMEGCGECEAFEFCKKCKDDWYLNDNKVCVTNCGDGYFKDKDTGTCKKCLPYCKECINDKECITCNKGYFLIPSKTECKTECDPHQVKLGGLCIECADQVNCLACDPSSVQICTDCDKATSFLKDNKCVDSCGEHYYVKYDNICDKCPANCKTCNGDRCFTCDEGTYLIDSQRCVGECPDGYIKSGTVCLKCTNEKCRKCIPDNLDTCTDCYPYKFLKEGNCVDKCDIYYYEKDSKTCDKCIKGCKECIDGVSCQVCKDDWYKMGSICVEKCEDGMRPNEQRICEYCTVNDCVECYENKEICEKCKKFLFNNKCYEDCPVGTYLPPEGVRPIKPLKPAYNPNPAEEDKPIKPLKPTYTNNICYECGSYCDKCYDKENCYKCKYPKVLQGKICEDTCYDNFRETADKECARCVDPLCKKCNENEQCIECFDDKYLHDGKCVSPCPDGTFIDGRKCSPCKVPCLKCVDNPDKCTECITDFGLTDNNQCTNECPSGTVMNKETKTCDKCTDKGCILCQANDPTICVKCESPYGLRGGDCHDPCPIGTYNSNNVCNTCLQNCEVCNNYETCITCTVPYMLKNSKSECVYPCGDGWMKSEGECVKCLGNCVECKLTDLSTCTKCDKDTALYNGKCISSCPAGTWNKDGECVACDITHCETCPKGTCTQCAYDYVFDKDICIPKPCPEGKVEISGRCMPCGVENCKTCPPADTTLCTECISPQVLVSQRKCEPTCPNGMYEIIKDGIKKCENCISNCEKCSNNYRCEKCNPGQYLEEGVCVEKCSQGYRIDGTNCVKCSIDHCAECSETECFKCKDPLYLTKADLLHGILSDYCSSDCLEKYYKDDRELKRCRNCPTYCDKCTLGICDECDKEHALDDKKDCVDECPPGTVKKDGKCLLCQADIKCKVCNPDKLSECFECQNNLVLMGDKCVPTCDKGYYRDYPICKPCLPNCEECDSGDKCKVCAEKYFLYQDKCIAPCEDGYYGVDRVCKSCIPKCKICDADSCKECYEGFILEENECKSGCSTGYYQRDKYHCEKCEQPCLECTETECKVCPSGLRLKNGKCVPQCGNGFSDDGIECKPCISNCDECKPVPSDKCDVCAEGWFLKEGVCVDKCDTGYYKDGKNCLKCIEKCQECEDGTSCKTCEPNYVYDQNKKKCVEQCDDGYKKDVKLCLPCTKENCKKCDQSPEICDKCLSDAYKLDADCVKLCPPEEYFIDGPDCKHCPIGCKTCTVNECKSCKDGFSLQRGECVSNCDPGSVSVDGVCKPCSTPGCSICDKNNTDLCLLCLDNKVRVPKIVDGKTLYTCEVSCPEGFFEKDKVCYACGPLCKYCIDEKTCTDCQEGKPNQEGVCKEKCDPGYVERNGKCLKCTDGNCVICDPIDQSICKQCNSLTKLQGTICKPSCDAGYFEEIFVDHSECHPCSGNCKTCTDKDHCTECMTDYFLKENVCVKPCGPGWIEDGNVCHKCTQNDMCNKCTVANLDICKECLPEYFITPEKKCVNTCGDRFYAQSSSIPKECIPCNDPLCITCDPENICTQCQAPNVVYNGICKSECPPNWYEDPNNHYCYQCQISPCTECLPADPTKCIKCPDGMKKYQNACLSDCPIGTFSNINNECIDCGPNCEKCLSEKHCTKCKDIVIYALNEQNQCTDKCPLGSVNVNGQCQQCTQAPQCEICNPKNLSECIDCQSTLYKKDGKCIEKCPTEDGSFIRGRNCYDCEKYCKVCTDEVTCQICDSEHVEQKSDCVETCADGSTNVNGHCVPCRDRDNCIHCAADLATCTKCRDPLLLASGLCIVSCDPGYYYDEKELKCIKCIDNCGNCKNGSSCDRCLEPTFLNPLTGQCVKPCPERYYGDSNNDHPVCKQCTDFTCKYCDAQNPKKCTECESNLYLYSLPDGDNDCVLHCPEEYFYESQPDYTCQKCPVPCKKCTSKDVCTECIDTYTLQDTKCLSDCLPGYVNRDGKCLKCGTDCETCSKSNLDICYKCITGYLYNNQCYAACPDKYYPDDKKECQPCPKNCLHCTKDSCSDCIPDFYFLENTNQCVDCQKPKVLENKICKPCKINDCKECVAGDSTKCRVCEAGRYLYDDKCVGSCPAGYFINGDKCEKCSDHCITCNSKDQCTVCESGFLVSNGICSDHCEDKFRKNVVAGTCDKCYQEKCLKCDDDVKICTKCENNGLVFNGKCVDKCPDGYFLENNQCIACPLSCEKCDSSKCIKCPEFKKIKDKECVTNCGNEFWDDGKECKPCQDSLCLKCSSENVCIECKNGTFLNPDGKCKDSCPQGYFLDSAKKECIKCQTGCEVCTAEKCITCLTGFFMYDNQCTGTCPEGYTPVDKTCVKCVQGECLQCANNAPEICVNCKDGFVLYNGQCKQDCPPGKFKDGKTCSDCGPMCEICENKDVCIKCFPEFTKNGKVCENGCPNGKVKLGDKCESCGDDNCNVCQGDVNVCIECKGDYKLFHDTCVLDCPHGFFDNKKGKCEPCHVGCDKCTADSCIICKQGYFMYKDTCYAKCPDGEYGDCADHICKQCNSACKTCVEKSNTDCLVCNDGYYYNDVFGNCVKPDECPVGSYPDKETSKCVRCKVPHCTQCMSADVCSQCSRGYALTDEGKCAQAQVITPILSKMKLFDSYTAQDPSMRAKEAFAISDFKGVGVGAPDVSFSFFFRILTRELYGNPTILYVNNNSADAYNVQFSIEKEYCMLRVGSSELKLNRCTYEDLYKWTFYTLTISKVKSDFSATVHTLGEDGKLAEFKMPVPGNSKNQVMNKLAVIQINDFDPLAKPANPSQIAFQMYNLNIMDYAPGYEQMYPLIESYPPVCDYFCTNCKGTCLACPTDTIPVENRCKANKSNVISAPVPFTASSPAYSVHIRTLVNQIITSDAYGITGWFYLQDDKLNELVNTSIKSALSQGTQYPILSVKVAPGKVIVNGMEYPVVQINKNNWSFIAVGIKAKQVVISLRFLDGAKFDKVVEYSTIRLFDDTQFNFGTGFIGSIAYTNIYINNVPSAEDITVDFSKLKCPDKCIECSADMSCSKCKEEYIIGSNGYCQEASVPLSEMIIERFDVFNKEYQLYSKVNAKESWTLSLWFRKKLFSFFTPITNSLVQIVGTTVTLPLITENIADGTVNYIFSSQDFSEKVPTGPQFAQSMDYYHAFIVFNKTTSEITFDVKDIAKNEIIFHKTGAFYPKEQYGLDFSLMIGDKNEKDMNMEFSNVEFFREALGDLAMDKVRTRSKPIDCDPACKKCDIKTGKCSECGYLAPKADATCKIYFIGFIHSFVTTTSAKADKLSYSHLMTMNSFNVGVNSMKYSMFGHIKNVKLPSAVGTSGRYRIFTIGNLGKQYAQQSVGRISLDLVSRGGEGSLEFLIYETSPTPQSVIVKDFSVASNGWFSIHAGIDVEKKLFSYMILEDATGKMYTGEYLFQNTPDKIQELGGITLFGLNDIGMDLFKYQTPNTRVQDIYLAPNVGVNADNFKLYNTNYKTKADPVCASTCISCAYNNVNFLPYCMECQKGYKLNSDGSCSLSSVSSNFLDYNKGIITLPIEYQLIDTSLVQSTYYLLFQFRRNYYYKKNAGQPSTILKNGPMRIDVEDDKLIVGLEGKEDGKTSIDLIDPVMNWHKVLIQVSGTGISMSVEVNNKAYIAEFIAFKNKNFMFSNSVERIKFDPLDQQVEITNVKIFSGDGAMPVNPLPTEYDYNSFYSNGQLNICQFGKKSNQVCSKEHTYFQGDMYYPGNGVKAYDLLAKIPSPTFYRSNDVMLKFSVIIDKNIDYSIPIVRVANKNLPGDYQSKAVEAPTYEIRFNPVKGIMTFDALIGISSAGELAINSSVQLPTMPRNKMFSFIMGVKDMNLYYAVAESASNAVPLQYLPVKQVPALVGFAKAVFFFDDDRKVQNRIGATVEDIKFYYDTTGMDVDTKWKKHYQKHMKLIQDACDKGTSVECSVCKNDYPLNAAGICMPSADTFVALNDAVSPVSVILNNIQSLKYDSCPDLNAVQISFWFRLTSLQSGRMGLLKATYANDVDLLSVIYDANKNILDLVLHTNGRKVSLDSLIPVTAPFDWINISINYQILNGHIFASIFDKEGTKLNSRSVDVDKHDTIRADGMLTLNYGFSDDNTDMDVQFEVYGCEVVANSTLNELEMDTFRFNTIMECMSACSVPCQNKVCPKKNLITSEYTISPSKKNEPLFKMIKEDEESMNTFFNYLISFEVNPNSLKPEVYKANPNTLFVIHHSYTDEMASLLMEDIIPPNIFNDGISASFENNQLKIQIGSVPWFSALETMTFDFKDATFTAPIYVSLLVHAEDRTIRIVVMTEKDALIKEFDLSSTSLPSPLNSKSLIFVNPQVQNFKINVSNLRFDVDYYGRKKSNPINCVKEDNNDAVCLKTGFLPYTADVASEIEIAN